ncbi:hypothetical protein [Oceanicola granulosus]|nr:hypothetical protein [Oceanicola granulosus]
MKHWLVGAACLLTAACGDPLRDVGRLSDISVADPAANVAATGTGPLLSEARDAAGTLEAEAVAAAQARSAAAPPRGLGALFGRGAGAAGPTPAAAPGGFGLGRLFGGGSRGSGASEIELAEVAPGTSVPYGAIARACDVPASRLGTRVAAASGYEVFDTVPNSTAPRIHYITGFADGCTRTFTGALVMLGDVGTYETVRYGAGHPATTAADRAYEAIKARICRAAQGQPCGGQIDRLAQDTTFLTVYDRFGGGGEWVEILLHDGGVAAIDVKS